MPRALGLVLSQAAYEFNSLEVLTQLVIEPIPNLCSTSSSLEALGDLSTLLGRAFITGQTQVFIGGPASRYWPAGDR